MRTRKEIVEIIADRDGLHCYLCNKEFTEKNKPTIEHVKPLAKGGTWDLDNLKLAHHRCNVLKGAREFLPDGTLEPHPPRRPSYRDRKLSKQKALDNFCEKCYNGRRLAQGESCSACDRDRSETLVPRYLWRQPKDCSHSDTACWMCLIGIIDRQSSLSILITGE